MTQGKTTEAINDNTVWGNVQFLWSSLDNLKHIRTAVFDNDLVSPYRMSTKLMREYGGLSVWIRHVIFMVKYWWAVHVLSKYFYRCQIRYLRRWGISKNRASQTLGFVLVPKFIIQAMQNLAVQDKALGTDNDSRTCVYSAPDTVHQYHSLSFRVGVVLDDKQKYTCRFTTSESKRFIATFVSGKIINQIVNIVVKRSCKENTTDAVHDNV